LGQLLFDQNNKLSPKIKNLVPYPYQYKCSLEDLLNSTESRNQDVTLTEFVSHLKAVYKKQEDTRRHLRIYNILDLNIVPINVHAFMREVPFVNILNYSYTFDKMVHRLVLPRYVNNDQYMIGSNDQAHTTRELLVKLLVHPYAELSVEEYYGLLGSLFNGNDNMKLGRPRYLSDQLWHKALLTSSASNVDANRRPLEMGPAAYEVIRSTQAQTNRMRAVRGGAAVQLHPYQRYMFYHLDKLAGTTKGPESVSTYLGLLLTHTVDVFNQVKKNDSQLRTHGDYTPVMSSILGFCGLAPTAAKRTPVLAA
jgi:hypothetical protein